MRAWFVYLLECADETLYCGVTKNTLWRLDQHNTGKGAKYTKGRRPCKLIAQSCRLTKSEALRVERHVKRSPKNRKSYTISTALAWLVQQERVCAKD